MPTSHHAGPVFLVCGGLIALLLVAPDELLAQVMGDDQELARLRNKAEDAIASDDPDGAAMMMGRAALLSAQVARKRDAFSGVVYRRMESLFRAQEHTYRGMSLFRRAGGQLPASSGVCGSLSLAVNSLRQAAESLGYIPSPPPAPHLLQEIAHLKEAIENWNRVTDSMIAEYQCP